MPVNTHSNHQMTKVENFSLTGLLTDELHKWSHNTEQPVLGQLGARGVGVIATPLASLIDTIVHLHIFVGKTLTGIFITPYNIVILQVNPKYAAPSDLELASALIHLTLTITSLFNTVILPLIILLDPCLAHTHTHGKKINK